VGGAEPAKIPVTGNATPIAALGTE
jgi:hypothetical protein